MIRVDRSVFDDLTRCTISALVDPSIHRAIEPQSPRAPEPQSPRAFFISAESESRDKLAMFEDDPNYARFEEEGVKPQPNTGPEYIFETEPGRDPRYSWLSLCHLMTD